MKTDKHLLQEVYTERSLAMCAIASDLFSKGQDVSVKDPDESEDPNYFILYFQVYGIEQFSYHMPIEFRSYVNIPLSEDVGVVWDGHTKEEAIERLNEFAMMYGPFAKNAIDIIKAKLHPSNFIEEDNDSYLEEFDKELRNSNKNKLQTLIEFLRDIRNNRNDTEVDKLLNKYNARQAITRIFISAPCASNPNYVEHFKQLGEDAGRWYVMARRGLDRKYRIINPIMDIKSTSCDCHVTSDDYRYESLELLKMCDILVMGKGWEQAEGCVEERTLAIIMGMEVVYEEDIKSMIGYEMDSQSVIDFDREMAIKSKHPEAGLDFKIKPEDSHSLSNLDSPGVIRTVEKSVGGRLMEAMGLREKVDTEVQDISIKELANTRWIIGVEMNNANMSRALPRTNSEDNIEYHHQAT